MPKKYRHNSNEAFINKRRLKLFDRTQPILDAEDVELNEAALQYADEMMPGKARKK